MHVFSTAPYLVTAMTMSATNGDQYGREPQDDFAGDFAEPDAYEDSDDLVDPGEFAEPGEIDDLGRFAEDDQDDGGEGPGPPMGPGGR
jgi:hypothetical protein